MPRFAMPLSRFDMRAVDAFFAMMFLPRHAITLDADIDYATLPLFHCHAFFHITPFFKDYVAMITPPYQRCPGHAICRFERCLCYMMLHMPLIALIFAMMPYF